jgi:alkane 1-monooxygenase
MLRRRTDPLLTQVQCGGTGAGFAASREVRMAGHTTEMESSQERGGPGPHAFFLIYAITGSFLWVASRGGYYTLVAPLAVTFVAVPLLDLVIGVDPRNATLLPSAFRAAVFRLATWLALPIQAAILIWGAAVVAKATTPLVEIVGATIAVGITGGVVGITVSHELVHRSNRLERALGRALLVMVCYYHWATEHVAGHHRRVATLEDPATARLGESLPVFLVRSIVQTLVSSWQLEAARNARRGIRSPLRNQVIFGVVASVAVALAIYCVFGSRSVGFFLGQALVAIGFLETINYIEHYGLQRRELRPGVYERVTPAHSWNASQRLTNVLLFNLQRHSDHHAYPIRPYYTLRHHPEAPQLPTGYAGMALLAMVPPLWRRVMDPRVRAHRARCEAAASSPTSASPTAGARA